MHIIYPVVVGSNAMEVLSGDLFGGYTHLMEFRSNERLRRAFPYHPVGTALLGRDIRSEFLPGARLDVDSHGTTIVCLGVSPQMGPRIIQDLVSRLADETPLDEIILLSMFREIPGVNALWDAFASAGVSELEWSRFSAMMRGGSVDDATPEPIENIEEQKDVSVDTSSIEIDSEPSVQVASESLPSVPGSAAVVDEPSDDAATIVDDPVEDVVEPEVKENSE